MAARRFNWTTKMESDLIDLVQERPSIWNPADINYIKKSHKKMLYEEISDEMGRRWPEQAAIFDAAFMHEKFSTMRSYFQREEKKIKALSLTNPADYLSKWIHFQRLLFLKDPAAASSSESMLDSSFIEEPECIISENHLENTLDGETSTSHSAEDTGTIEELGAETTSIRPFFAVPPRKQRKLTRGEESLSFTSSGSQNLQAASMSSAMGHLVQTILRSLSPEDSSEFTQDLLGLIAKYVKNPQKLNCSK